MKTPRRWNRISGSGRRRIERIVVLMRARDASLRRAGRPLPDGGVS